MDLSDDDELMEPSLGQLFDLHEQQLDAMLVDLDIDYQAATQAGVQHAIAEFDEFATDTIKEIVEDIPDELHDLIQSEKEKYKDLGGKEFARETFWDGVGDVEDLMEDVIDFKDTTSKYFGVEGDAEGIHKEMQKDIHEATHPIDPEYMKDHTLKDIYRESHKKKPGKGTKLSPYDSSKQRRKHSEVITPPTPMRKKEGSKSKKPKRGKTVYFPSKEDPSEEKDLPPKGGGRRKKRRRR